jgi:CheY-like chemotaxis protein
MRRVLVVDDNRDSAESLAALLGMLGHEVDQAYDGPAALATARTRFPDLVLLDIGMPGMSGHEVARQIRAEPALLGTTLIALTGYGSAEDRHESRAAGFDGHLVKPIDFEALQRIIEGLPPAQARRSEAA